MNRARSMPQQPWLVAGCSDDDRVNIFDLKQAAAAGELWGEYAKKDDRTSRCCLLGPATTDVRPAALAQVC